jgi:uncharacterized Zn-finger protein
LARNIWRKYTSGYWLTMAQPRPMAAIDLIHKQPVRWTEKKVVSCDGGGGPLGHPRIFINTDKPAILPCGYCGLPFVCCPKYIERARPTLTLSRHTCTIASTLRACPPHPTLSTLLTTLLLFLATTCTLLMPTLDPLSLSNLLLADLSSRDRCFHTLL